MPKTLLHLSGSMMDRAAVREQVRNLNCSYQHLAKSAIQLEQLLEEKDNFFVIDLGYIGTDALNSLVKSQEFKSRAVAYCSHVERELISQAEKAGLNVMPRSKFFTNMSEIITSLKV